MALKAGVKKGGAAKGELVLAIFELANCFRHGWGIAKDPIAAKQVSHLASFVLGLATASQNSPYPRATLERHGRHGRITN